MNDEEGDQQMLRKTDKRIRRLHPIIRLISAGHLLTLPHTSPRNAPSTDGGRRCTLHRRGGGRWGQFNGVASI